MSAINERMQPLRALMKGKGLDSLVLRRNPNLAWAIAGRAHVPTTIDAACFDLIIKNNSLTAVTNSIEAPRLVAEEFPQVGTAYNHVDAACIYFVQDPQRYDVIVTDNLFGDILTDLGGAVSGGIGVASSANLNPKRTGPSMFEPVHGSAPDIVGTGKANPVAAILSAAHMLEFLGEHAGAATLRAACEKPSAGSTSQIGDEIAARVVAK